MVKGVAIRAASGASSAGAASAKAAVQDSSIASATIRANSFFMILSSLSSVWCGIKYWIILSQIRGIGKGKTGI